MASEIAIHDTNSLKDKIYTIRGVQVMLDSDLAEIYGYATKDLNRQVKIIQSGLMKIFVFN